MKSRAIKDRFWERMTSSRRCVFIATYFFISTLIPNLVLTITEDYSIWSKEALIMIPLGFYMMWSILLRRSGIMILVGFLFTFLAAFQIVLLYLFGNSIIATDMFTNLLTTNPREAGELLGNIYPAVICVCVIYLPLLAFAIEDIARHRIISRKTRVIIGLIGAVIFSMGLILLYPAYEVSKDKHVLRNEIFPLNVMYNATLSVQEYRKVYTFEESSANFIHQATRSVESDEREVYVYIIGEASRAMNWQLYGYERETNPRLSKLSDVHIFSDILTQSNTTHKSVPMFLSSVSTHEHTELYNRSGLPALFNEVGFDTWFISNQAPQNAMIDKLAQDANQIVYLGYPDYDIKLLETMKNAIESSKSQKILFILHCYGSHFNYNQRYPAEFSHFKPDTDVVISEDNKDQILNAYDNSVLYTDYLLEQIIKYLHNLNVQSALLYCADHGEDLIDDDRGRFLHSSPTTTAYQLYTASLSWFSSKYTDVNRQKVENLIRNCNAPSTTRFMFHTMADIASIQSKYLHPEVAFTSDQFNSNADRFYKNDHNEAVPFQNTGLVGEDYNVFERWGVDLQQ